MRTLPDGTVIDDSDPEQLEAAMAAMTPEQRAELVAEFERRRAERRQQRSR
jgi:Spy/CpxP family protein refolding chaperone